MKYRNFICRLIAAVIMVTSVFPSLTASAVEGISFGTNPVRRANSSQSYTTTLTGSEYIAYDTDTAIVAAPKASSETDDDAPVISLYSPYTYVERNESFCLNYEVANASSYEFYSSDSNCATVSSDGYVTIHDWYSHSVIITLRAYYLSDTSKYVEKSVVIYVEDLTSTETSTTTTTTTTITTIITVTRIVEPTPTVSLTTTTTPITVTSIVELTPPTVSLSSPYTYVQYYNSSFYLDYEVANASSYEFYSSNSNYAKVDSDGYVTVYAESYSRDVTITLRAYYLFDTSKYVEKSVVIYFETLTSTETTTTTTAPSPVISLYNPDISDLYVGNTFQIDYDEYYSTEGITWESSDTSVANVDSSGNVTIKGAGEATITATVRGYDYSYAYDSVTFTTYVKSDSTDNKYGCTDEEIENASVKATLSIGTVSGNPGEEVTIPISVDNGEWCALGIHVVYDERLTLISKDRIPAISLVDFDFTQTGIGKGVLVFAAFAENCGVTGAFASLTFQIPDDAESGDFYPVTFYVYQDDEFRGLDGDMAIQAWTFNNGLVDGGVYVSGATTTTTTASTTTTTATTTISADTPAIIPSSLTMNPGDANTLLVMNVPEGSTIQWTSDNTGVVTVSGGVVTAVSAGTATVYALVGNTLCSCKVMVVSKNYIPGDADGNGIIEIADAVKIMCYITDKESTNIEVQGILNGDVYQTGDGLSVQDALAIQKYLAQIITKLPES